MKNKRRRSIVKAITFRLLATATTMILVYFITGDLALANAIGVLDLTTKIVLYYAHDRIWERIKWGKQILTQTV